MAKYFVGIDQGTTLTTAAVTDESCRLLAKASRSHTNTYPHPGWVEQSATEIFDNCLGAVFDAINKIPGARLSDILGIGLDHQGETCLVWDKHTGLPVYNMIVWQDKRTAATADELEKKYGEYILKTTGVTADAYYSATKLAWILDNTEDGRKRYNKGDLLVGTFNTYFHWRLTNGRVYVTDPGSASCMMLSNLEKGEWDEKCLEMVGLKKELMPEIKDSIELYRYTDPEFFGVKVALCGALEDSSAGIIGGGCAGEGIFKTSYGTGNFLSLQTGNELIPSKENLFSNSLWSYKRKQWFRLRGSCYACGSAVEWLKNGLNVIESPKDTETLALSVENSGGVYFVPAFSGLATPFWDQYARAMFIGITGGTTRAHMVRSVLESIAYQVAYCYDIMCEAYGKRGSVMRADGGPVENGFLMQLQSDMLGIPIEIPDEKETAAYGSACAAGLVMGALSEINDVRKFVTLKNVYEPHMSHEESRERLSKWLKAVERCRGWEE